MVHKPDSIKSISIHALREESDSVYNLFLDCICYFNPRSPRGERQTVFRCLPCVNHNFNPRSPRGERPPPSNRGVLNTYISIHALREESDINKTNITCMSNRFQSTLSARRATTINRQQLIDCTISIHALREESNFKWISNKNLSKAFQSTLSARRATCINNNDQIVL